MDVAEKVTDAENTEDDDESTAEKVVIFERDSLVAEKETKILQKEGSNWTTKSC